MSAEYRDEKVKLSEKNNNVCTLKVYHYMTTILTSPVTIDSDRNFEIK